MENVEKFKNVLKGSETVVAVEKCNKKAKVLGVSFWLFCVSTFLLLWFLILQNTVKGFPFLVTILVPLFFYILTAITILLNIKAADNYYVCLTNKRIIERYGVFTSNYRCINLEHVSGNILITYDQSIFAKDDSTCRITGSIELAPVGHGSATIWTNFIVNGYEFAKKLEEQVKINSKYIDKPTKE